MIEYYKNSNEIMKLELNEKLNKYFNNTKQEFNSTYNEIDELKNIMKQIMNEQENMKIIPKLL